MPKLLEAIFEGVRFQSFRNGDDRAAVARADSEALLRSADRVLVSGLREWIYTTSDASKQYQGEVAFGGCLWKELTRSRLPSAPAKLIALRALSMYKRKSRYISDYVCTSQGRAYLCTRESRKG
jgi:hypothetical protein